ncbi:NACHT domain-containing protein [Laspinema olomoucense]|uniref:NACHT domain-containing protein n=1 Tax=Laspinema olomoucense TaxID=3231600 RepID=UPI0021BAB8CE|nr:NACHT domain-containing protein [Laspinema sp. D3d]MCT7973611.1 NACHT domain-containing protein [Laspinema sp. D3d]
MPKISPAFILILTVLVNGFFCMAIAITAASPPSLGILLGVLTLGCGLLCALTCWLPGGRVERGFWLFGVLPLIAAVSVYFLLVSESLNPAFQGNLSAASVFLWALGTGLPTVLSIWQRWQGWQSSPIAQRSALLAAVESEAIARQQQSLHYAVHRYLVREPLTEDIPRLWDVEVKIGKHPRRKIEAEQRILEGLKVAAPQQAGIEALNAVGVRADPETGALEVGAIAGIVLILGAPGSGKTTTLLELAGDLCDRARQKELEPVPVVLDLAHWRDQTPLLTWIEEEVCRKYNVNPKLVRELLSEDRLLPLLDGLDELEGERQEHCLKEIAQSRRQNGQALPLVLCTRMDTYQLRQTRLRLYAAVGVQPLTMNQIERYLLASRSRELWENLQTDPTLFRLAKTPLFLNLMTVAYEEILIHSWKRLKTRDERQRYVFNAYIRRQLSREMEKPIYSRKAEPPAEQTKLWLRWLSGVMGEGNQRIFSPASLPALRLQPTGKQLQYPLALLGLFIILYAGLFALIYGWEVGGIYGILFGIIALSCGGIIALKASDIELTTTSPRTLWQSAIASVSCCLLGFLSFQLIGAILSAVTPSGGWVMYLLSVLFFMGATAPILGLVAGLITGIPWMKHLIVRLILWRRGDIPWNYSRFLEYVSQRLFLQRVGWQQYRFIHELLRDRLSES